MAPVIERGYGQFTQSALSRSRPFSVKTVDTCGGTVSHPFGDLVTQHLSRKHGLSQNKLAEGVDQDPAVVSAMCNGRRLTGHQARERVLAVVRWFSEQGVLDTRAEADALLEAAGMARLRPDRRAEADLLNVLPRSQPLPDNRPIDATQGRPHLRGRRQIPWKAILAAVAALGVIGTITMLGIPALRGAASPAPVWQETFDPLHGDQWQLKYASAVWEDTPGPGAVLRENHPVQDYGKAESVPIAADIGNYPLLRVSVTAVDPGASYSVQILDKGTNTHRDVLHEVLYPGEHVIDLAQAMDWSGLQVFTINLWIGGESKTITVSRISIEADRPASR
jgi:hypothetical protein